jgi:hypothetical protein
MRLRLLEFWPQPKLLAGRRGVGGRRLGTNHSPGSSRTAKELFCRMAELEEATLTIDKARELACALLTMADAV